MSISVDDLVSSLSANHIGQEAMDLAALQAQLYQTALGQALSMAGRHSSYSSKTQPCNTPTAHTPISGSFSSGMEQQNSFSMWDSADDTMDEDERMVEDLLIPNATASSSSTSSTSFRDETSSRYMSDDWVGFSSSPSTYSHFTATDPFYASQVQASRNASNHLSYFAQSGRPAEDSPFLKSGVTSAAWGKPDYGHALHPIKSSSSTSATGFNFDNSYHTHHHHHRHQQVDRAIYAQDG